jgi:hypothetical protein
MGNFLPTHGEYQNTYRPFCPNSRLDSNHRAKHNLLECIHKPEEDRAFTRKDHLKLHINKRHLIRGEGMKGDIQDVLDSWARQSLPFEKTDPELHCGFCGRRFEAWKDRVEHVANHFKDGLDLSSWWPQREETLTRVTKYNNPPRPQR